MLHTTLSKGKHIAQRKKGKVYQSPGKRDRKYCKPRSKTGLLIIYMCTNQPRSMDRAYNQKKPAV